MVVLEVLQRLCCCSEVLVSRTAVVGYGGLDCLRVYALAGEQDLVFEVVLLFLVLAGDQGPAELYHEHH